MRTKTILYTAIVIALIAVATYLIILSKQGLEIGSFEDCSNAGYPVMESYPRQCRTPDGRTFVEEVCVNMCGDGQCQEIVCLAIGCPCAETPESCPEDCT